MEGEHIIFWNCSLCHVLLRKMEKNREIILPFFLSPFIVIPIVLADMEIHRINAR